MTENLSLTVILRSDFDSALERVVAALKAQGFGVLTRIDVRATMKEKLGIDFRPYVILGACNPPLAHRALTSDPAIGIMLPCNVTLEQVEEDEVIVSLVNPAAMLTAGRFGESEELLSVGEEARTRIQNVVAQLED
ncbi:MAG: DUF302 domain-containing protein [Anaerolineales bacterium]|nr:DUF302 domain-containing protein [Anaerolineales bacterium]